MPFAQRRPSSSLLTLAAAAAIVLPVVGAPPALADVSGRQAAGQVTQPADLAALAVPTSGRPLPTALDVTARYNEQRSCDPAAQPGLEAYVRMVLQTYRQGRNGGVVRGCGLGSTSEHKEGRAFDWMVSVSVPAEKAAADSLTTWLTGKDSAGVVGGNARRLGVMYVIWNKRIWSVYRISEGWRPYTGSNPHTDHVHTSFSWDGAKMRTSWWDGSATVDDDSGPCRVYAGQPAPLYSGRTVRVCSGSLPAAPVSSYPIVWPGQSGDTVKVAQARLGVAADGVFGSGTRSALVSWQKRTPVPASGVLDKPTWARLVPTATPPATPHPSPVAGTSLSPYLTSTIRAGATGNAVRALQQALGVAQSGSFTAVTTTLVQQFQTAHGLSATGVVDPVTWARLQAATYPLLPYRASTVRTGSTGEGVKALQRALGLSPDGSFGPLTATAVMQAQTAVGLPATGVVSGSSWTRIEAWAYPLGGVGVALSGVPRLWGANRYETAADIASSFPAGVDTAYVASGVGFADALAGAARAGAGASPVLLTSAASLPGATRVALQRLRPQRIVLLGGAGVVTDAVRAQLAGLTAGTVTRLSGADRYATAAAVSSSIPAGVDTVYLAAGTAFPDALSGAALAGARRAPVLLTDPRRLPSSTRTELARLRPARVVVLGGKASVSDAVVAAVAQVVGRPVTRLAGADRYGTAAAVSAQLTGGNGVFVANGLAFPDALAGAALAGARGAPVLLVKADSVPAGTAGALSRLRPRQVTILGGPAAVTVPVGTAVDAYRTF